MGQAMSRRLLLFLAAVALANVAADLPPGAVLRLGDTRFGAVGPVAELVFSADGKQLTAWERGDRAKTVWDTTAWQPVRTIYDIQQVGAVIRWRPTAIGDSPRGVVINPDGVAVVRDFEANKDLA